MEDAQNRERAVAYFLDIEEAAMFRMSQRTHSCRIELCAYCTGRVMVHCPVMSIAGVFNMCSRRDNGLRWINPFGIAQSHKSLHGHALFFGHHSVLLLVETSTESLEIRTHGGQIGFRVSFATS